MLVLDTLFGWKEKTIAGLLMALLVTLFVLVGYGIGHLEGETKERELWRKKEQAQLIATQNAILVHNKTEQDKRDAESKKQAQILRGVNENHAKEIAKLHAERDADRAMVRKLGGLRISAEACRGSDPGFQATTETPSTDASNGSSTGTIALPPEVEEGLWDITSEADELSEQLRALQEWIKKEGFYESPQ